MPYGLTLQVDSQITKFMGPTWGPLGPCRHQMGPMLAPWTLLSGLSSDTIKREVSLTWKENKNVMLNDITLYVPVQ